MKSITFEVTECVKVWYQAQVTVSEEDVRRYYLNEIQDTQASRYLSDAEKAPIIALYQRMIEEFIDNDDHEAWEEVALNTFKRPAETVEEDVLQMETEIVETDGWDGEEEDEDEETADVC